MTLKKTESKQTNPNMVMVLGLPFHQTTLGDALSDALISLDGEESQYWVTPNLDFATQAHDDDDLRAILFYAHRVLCDGMPIVWMSRLLGAPIPERVAGSDLVLKLFAAAHKRPIKFFFFGSDDETLKEATKVLESTYKNLEVVGAISPPHAKIVDWNNAAYCEQIRKADPDILLVALGCPKQERWMITYYQEAGARLSIGVGASLDFITGRQLRAPEWMQKTGLEWFWRMSNDPKRLVKRYAKDLGYLASEGFKELRLIRRRKGLAKQIANKRRSAPVEETVCYEQLTWQDTR